MENAATFLVGVAVGMTALAATHLGLYLYYDMKNGGYCCPVCKELDRGFTSFTGISDDEIPDAAEVCE